MDGTTGTYTQDVRIFVDEQRSIRAKTSLLKQALIGILFHGSLAYSSQALTPIEGAGGISQEPTFEEGRQLLEKRKWKEAALAYRVLLKKDPKSIPALVNLSSSLVNIGLRQEALSLLSQATSRIKGEQKNFLIQKIRVISRVFLTNRSFQVYQDGLNLLSGEKYRSSREKLEKILIEEPENGEVLIRLGQSFLLDHNPNEALKVLKTARKLNPFEPEVRLWLGRSYHFLGNTQAAQEELRAAYLELKGSELAPLWLAEALAAGGQMNAGIRILEADTKGWPAHIGCLLSAARMRLLLFPLDYQSLWSARKDLQLALSRLDQYLATDSPSIEGDLGLDLRRPSVEMKIEIQNLFQQVQAKIEGVRS